MLATTKWPEPGSSEFGRQGPRMVSRCYSTRSLYLPHTVILIETLWWLALHETVIGLNITVSEVGSQQLHGDHETIRCP